MRAQRTVAWFQCFAGIAGDMALGALVDAGADADEVGALLGRLELPGWELHFEECLRGGIACTRAVVRVEERAVTRPYAVVRNIVADAPLPDRVRSRALAVFERLARVESALHRRAVDEVHFHEVGGHDAIVDVVGTAAALEVLGVDDITASAVATGTGGRHSAHGWLPNPAPATVRLLEGVPTYGRDVALELTTPTGAALLAGLASAFGPMPPMAITSSGYGAGRGELEELPNCTQVVVGRRAEAEAAGPGQPAVLLESNLDDVTGEQLGLALASALDAGAHDAWVSPVTMKKGRPGHVLHVLADPEAIDALRREIERVTGTLGVRALPVERWPVARTLEQVEVDGMAIRIKVAGHRAKPEFDDVARVAEKTGRPIGEVSSRAEEAWRVQHPPPSPGT
jgi:pyridinium-3,5-bisthiocarboxylic acid mononucleotide nickel chelatase